MKFSRRDLFKSAAVTTGGIAAGTAFGGFAAVAPVKRSTNGEPSTAARVRCLETSR